MILKQISMLDHPPATVNSERATLAKVYQQFGVDPKRYRRVLILHRWWDISRDTRFPWLLSPPRYWLQAKFKTSRARKGPEIFVASLLETRIVTLATGSAYPFALSFRTQHPCHSRKAPSGLVRVLRVPMNFKLIEWISSLSGLHRVDS